MSKLLCKIFFLAAGVCMIAACAAPRYSPPDLAELKEPSRLGEASQRAYGQAQAASEKQALLQYSQAGISYSEKCLKQEPENVQCLYYNVLNRGIFIKNHVPNYQRSLKVMVENCQTLLKVQPAYQNGGCYRVLGDIYSKAPAFSLDPKNITRDMELAQNYMRQAVQIAPNYALNHLFLARILEKSEQKQEAKQELARFDQLASPELDRDYPNWKKEREQLAQSLP